MLVKVLDRILLLLLLHADKKPETNLFSESKLSPKLRLEKVAPAGQLSMPKLELQMPKPDNPGNNNNKLQAPNDK